jgi:hypothetical protein
MTGVEQERVEGRMIMRVMDSMMGMKRRGVLGGPFIKLLGRSAWGRKTGELNKGPLKDIKRDRHIMSVVKI